MKELLGLFAVLIVCSIVCQFVAFLGAVVIGLSIAWLIWECGAWVWRKHKEHVASEQERIEVARTAEWQKQNAPILERQRLEEIARVQECERQAVALRAQLLEERRQLELLPTSSNSRIQGMRINRQIKMIMVDNFVNGDEAELEFLRRVRDAGGNGVINMRRRRHRGGYISIQGDAVGLAPSGYVQK